MDLQRVFKRSFASVYPLYVQKVEKKGRKKALFVADLTREQLEQVIAYRNLKGEQYREPLEVLLRHLVNHSTYHRGQVATQLRQLGLVPPATDYVVYRIELG